MVENSMVTPEGFLCRTVTALNGVYFVIVLYCIFLMSFMVQCCSRSYECCNRLFECHDRLYRHCDSYCLLSLFSTCREHMLYPMFLCIITVVNYHNHCRKLYHNHCGKLPQSLVNYTTITVVNYTTITVVNYHNHCSKLYHNHCSKLPQSL